MRIAFLLCLLLLVACAQPQKIEIEHDCDVLHLQDRVEWIARTYDWRMSTINKRTNAFGERLYKLEEPSLDHRLKNELRWAKDRLGKLEDRVKQLEAAHSEAERRRLLLDLRKIVREGYDRLGKEVGALSRGSGDKEVEQAGD